LFKHQQLEPKRLNGLALVVPSHQFESKNSELIDPQSACDGGDNDVVRCHFDALEPTLVETSTIGIKALERRMRHSISPVWGEKQ
jgi:hypothetical protein